MFFSVKRGCIVCSFLTFCQFMNLDYKNNEIGDIVFDFYCFCKLLSFSSV